MFSKLKLIKEDYTHDQLRSIETIKLWFKERKPVYCFDLTAATDRLPIALQSHILLLCGLSTKGCQA